MEVEMGIGYRKEKSRLSRWLLAGVLFVAASFMALRGEAQTTQVLLFEDFETFNDCNYSFGWHRPYDTTGEVVGAGNEWDCEHLANGGDKGTGDGAAHVIMRANKAQYNLGWNSRATGGTWAPGDSVWIGQRIRWDNGARVPFTGTGNGGKLKQFIFGAGGSGPQSRIIIYSDATTDGGGGCMLDAKDYANGPDPTDRGDATVYSWARPSHFGLSSSSNLFLDTTLRNRYWAMFPMIGVNGEDACGRSILVTAGDNATAPAPGPNSARPANGWYSMLVKVTSGPVGTAKFTTWVNNCTEATPTSSTMVSEIGVGGWGNYTHNIGAYIDGAPSQDLGYRIDDVLIARGAFPREWCEGGMSGPRPRPPEDVTVR